MSTRQQLRDQGKSIPDHIVHEYLPSRASSRNIGNQNRNQPPTTIMAESTNPATTLKPVLSGNSGEAWRKYILEFTNYLSTRQYHTTDGDGKTIVTTLDTVLTEDAVPMDQKKKVLSELREGTRRNLFSHALIFNNETIANADPKAVIADIEQKYFPESKSASVNRVGYQAAYFEHCNILLLNDQSLYVNCQRPKSQRQVVARIQCHLERLRGEAKPIHRRHAQDRHSYGSHDVDEWNIKTRVIELEAHYEPATER